MKQVYTDEATGYEYTVERILTTMWVGRWITGDSHGYTFMRHIDCLPV